MTNDSTVAMQRSAIYDLTGLLRSICEAPTMAAGYALLADWCASCGHPEPVVLRPNLPITTVPAETLAPCPFCGGPAGPLMGLIGCEPCAVVRRDAASWNRRAAVQPSPQPAGVVEALKASRAAMADYLEDHPHSAPHDCYATGPVTGNAVYDLVRCPGCCAEKAMTEAIAKIDAALQQLAAVQPGTLSPEAVDSLSEMIGGEPMADVNAVRAVAGETAATSVPADVEALLATFDEGLCEKAYQLQSGGVVPIQSVYELIKEALNAGAEARSVAASTPPAAAADPLSDLVTRFSAALLDKLRAAERKYGYSDAWMQADWREVLVTKLLEHVQKGDPRDVAAYCAFAWHHGWPVAPPAAAEGWRPISEAPQQPGRINVRSVTTWRWVPYKPTSEQHRRGIKGRWQCLAAQGWMNYDLPEGAEFTSLPPSTTAAGEG